MVISILRIFIIFEIIILLSIFILTFFSFKNAWKSWIKGGLIGASLSSLLILIYFFINTIIISSVESFGFGVIYTIFYGPIAVLVFFILGAVIGLLIGIKSR